ncbi:hypothetical protein PGB90_003177 [Kerria lacca]
MSLIPYLVNELVKDAYDPFSRLYDQNFGVDLFNDDLLTRRPSSLPYLANYYVRPFRHLHPNDSGMSVISDQKNQFKVNLDVQQFKPEEINVKVADDYLVVEGKHEEKQDKHGFISRQFTRRYKIPDNVEKNAIESQLSSDGILSISAPKKIEQTSNKEIKIPVQQTNKPAIKQSQKPAGEEKSTGDKMET